ncbi:unnamed protein product [Acanthosepion pharaonis]|uniref:C2H2-type domain-containing protein n=1 Tax=Acanthosepion pharaonis TaxID=158019 RepID=A0A812BS15_ACAPH|nr:unnamed protein product [Sepia pharaonis]
MATPKRKENSPKKSKKIYEAKDSSIPSRPRRVFEENMTRLQEVTNGSSNEQASYMSLDVLAQVATDKLRDDLKLQPKVTPKKTHLNSHIEQLAREANDPERQYRFIFTAEPLHVRNRKLSIKEAEKARKKKSISTNNSSVNGSNASRDSESDDEYEPNGNIAAAHCGQKPYPPMPKSELAKKGKMNVPEEEEPYSDEAEELATSKKKKKDTEKYANEWERKIALRCIRELKNRKKDDKIPLVCQICCDKTFTASATLMYHYRSHAGIKPFICVLCLTTFTRQHSLNYHMLIHNNQSRFTCADCGRKFRHPSHFKEHLRRHTGETPFTCADCSQKFKTRNTYKRHLKTRHGSCTIFVHSVCFNDMNKSNAAPCTTCNSLGNSLFS